MISVYRLPNYRVLIVAPVAAVLLTLGACSSTSRGGYFEDDGPGRRTPDVSNTPDAVPKVEPRSARGNKPYSVYGVSYTPLADTRGYRERGVASWYGTKFHGRSTSSGEPYDMYAMTAAHKTLPLPAYLRVRNLQNDRTVVVRVNDRGPFLHNRLIDLSYAAASKLGILGTGTGLVEIEAIDPGNPTPSQIVQAPSRKIEIISTAEASVRNGQAQLFVQAGAFKDLSNAQALCTQLESASIGPVSIQSPSSDGAGTIYRVRVGPVISVQDGDRLADTLERQGIRDAIIVVE